MHEACQMTMCKGSRPHTVEGKHHARDPAPIQGDLATKWHAICAELEENYRDFIEIHKPKNSTGSAQMRRRTRQLADPL